MGQGPELEMVVLEMVVPRHGVAGIGVQLQRDAVLPARRSRPGHGVLAEASPVSRPLTGR
jgi:hypothetical protein